MEFNDGNQWHFVTSPAAYLRERHVYEMRTSSAKNGRNLYIDPQFTLQRAILQPRVSAYLHYHFPYQGAGSPEHQADFFCDAIGTLRSNEMIMLDTEGASGLVNPADFMRRWCARAESRLGTLSWIYVPRDLSRELTRSVTGSRLVKAPRYSGYAGRGAAPDWSHDVWQYSDRGHFPGANGPGDINFTSLSAAELLSRCRRSGGAAPLPSGGGRPMLRRGDSGPAVRELQELLSRV